MLTNSWVIYYVVLEKPIVHNTPYLDYYSHGKKELENSGCVVTILMDLSKGYDCIPHDFLIAKLELSKQDKIAIYFLLYYLCRRKQISKGWLTYQFSYAVLFNDARGWGCYHSWRFEIFWIWKLIYCNLLPL